MTNFVTKNSIIAVGIISSLLTGTASQAREGVTSGGGNNSSTVALPGAAGPGIGLDERGFDGKTQLMRAILEQDVPLSLTLLNIPGQDLNAQDQNGNTALILAAQRGLANIVVELVRKGALISIRNSVGRSVIEESAQANQLYMVELMVQAGARLDFMDNYGRTALMYAVIRGNYAASSFLLDLLVDQGIDTNMRDQDGRSVFFYACANGLTSLAATILEKSGDKNIDQNDVNGVTPLLQTIRNKKTNTVNWLLSIGANVNHIDNDGKTPLYEAILAGDEALVVSLVTNYKANIEHIVNSGRTAVFYAVGRGQFNLVYFLVESGANTKRLDVYGKDYCYYSLEEAEVSFKGVPPIFGSNLYQGLPDSISRNRYFNKHLYKYCKEQKKKTKK